jgi:hypothetical protein
MSRQSDASLGGKLAATEDATAARHDGGESAAVILRAAIETWLRERPDATPAELLALLRAGGYRGGKSALYETVREDKRELIS